MATWVLRGWPTHSRPCSRPPAAEPRRSDRVPARRRWRRRESLLRGAIGSGFRNVVMLEQQPRHRMPVLSGLCDAALVFLRRSPIGHALPSKMLEAIAMSPTHRWGGRRGPNLAQAARGRAAHRTRRIREPSARPVLQLVDDPALGQIRPAGPGVGGRRPRPAPVWLRICWRPWSELSGPEFPPAAPSRRTAPTKTRMALRWISV